MAKKNDKEVQLTAAEKLVNKTNGWLSKHGKLLTIIVSAVVAVIVIVSIVTVVVNTSNNKTYEKLDALTAQYSEYTTMDSDAEGYDSAKTALVSDAEALMAKGVKKYPGAKAAMILADLAYEDGDYSKAIETILIKEFIVYIFCRVFVSVLFKSRCHTHKCNFSQESLLLSVCNTLI